MRIHVYCSDPHHPVVHSLQSWVAERKTAHDVALLFESDELSGGDLLFLVSVSAIINQEIRQRYGATIVLHASDLPRGRGWSPLVWQVLEGRVEITVSALSAEDRVDTGAIWAQRTMRVEKHELLDEIHSRLFSTELALIDDVIAGFHSIKPREQSLENTTLYRKRTPEDSKIDPQRAIAEQFDLLRISDTDRYPAFFELHGHRYRLRIDKLS